MRTERILSTIDSPIPSGYRKFRCHCGGTVLVQNPTIYGDCGHENYCNMCGEFYDYEGEIINKEHYDLEDDNNLEY